MSTQHRCIGFNGRTQCNGNCISMSKSVPPKRSKRRRFSTDYEPHVCMSFNGPKECDGNCLSTRKSPKKRSIRGVIPLLVDDGDIDIPFKDLRQKVIDTCLDMNRMGINQGTSGNVSVRLTSDFFAVTPSGVSYESLKPSMIVIMDLEEKPGYFGDLLPSSEWRIHYDIYKRFEDAKAIVHAHSTFSTALSCCKSIKEIPPFHYMVAAAGGKSIAKAEYATFGSQELSDNVYQALIKPKRRACLMANHGLVAYGPSLDKALWLTNEVECLAKQYMQILHAGLKPDILSKKEMKVILKKFKSYGKQPASTTPSRDTHEEMEEEEDEQAVSAPRKKMSIGRAIQRMS